VRQIELVNMRMESGRRDPEEPAELAELASWNPPAEARAGASGFGVPVQAGAALQEPQPHEFEMESMTQFLRAAPPELAAEVARLLGSELSLHLLPEYVSRRLPHFAEALHATDRHDHARQRLHDARRAEARIKFLRSAFNMLAVGSLPAGGAGLLVSSVGSGANGLSEEGNSALFFTSISLVAIGGGAILRCAFRRFCQRPAPQPDLEVMRLPKTARRMAQEWQASALLKLTLSGLDERSAMVFERQVALQQDWAVQAGPLTGGSDSALAAAERAAQLDRDLTARWKRLLIDEIGSHAFRERLEFLVVHGTTQPLGHEVRAAGRKVFKSMTSADSHPSNEVAQALLRLRESIRSGALGEYLRMAYSSASTLPVA
jgi:hypothetical protein